MIRKIVAVVLLAFTITSMTACFYASSSSNPPGPNAAVCAPGDASCQSTTKSSSWGFFF
jgi:hypothetical protein